MHAAQQSTGKFRYLCVISLALALSAAGWSQPSLTPETRSVTLNQSITGVDVNITSSTTEAITFASTIAYADGDAGGNRNWLRIQPSGATTPSTIALNLNSLAGMAIGTYTATVNLTPTAPSSAAASSITVTFNYGTGGGGGTVTPSRTTSIISTSTGITTFDNISFTTTSTTPIAIDSSVTTGGDWLSAQLNTNSVSANFPATLTITANAAGLGTGSYYGSVRVTPSGGTPILISVTLNVNGGGSSGTLTVTPTNVRNWSYTTGAFPVEENFGLISSTGAITYTATASSSNNWLLINGNTQINNGSIGAGITISPSAAMGSLTTGYYTGTIQIRDSNNATATLTVNLSVNGGTSSGLSITPQRLDLTAALNGSVQQRTLSVTSTTGGAFSTSTSASWLGATPSTTNLASNTPGTVTVTINPAGLPEDTYNASITVTVGSQSQAIPVKLTVGSGGNGGGSSTRVAPGTISLNWQAGGNPGFISRPQIAITGTSGPWSSEIAYGSSGSGWLAVSPTSGNGLPDQTTIFPNPTGLAEGNYSATITITTPDGPQTVTVNLSVTAAPILLPTPGGLIFNYQTGATEPSPQTVWFTSGDASDFDVAVTANAPWITVAPILAGQKSILISVDPAAKSGGLYSGSVTVTAGSLPAVSLPVVLVVNGGTGSGGNGLLTFSPESLAFSATTGTNPASKQLAVTSDLERSFSVSTNQTWLSVSSAYGTTNTNLTVSVASSNLSAGTYSARITFTSGGQIQTVPVTLTVTAGSGNVTVTPSPSTGLAFTAQAGSGALTNKTLQVDSAGSSPVNFTVQATTQSGGNWLSTNVSSTVSTPQTLAVTVNATGLAAGTYTGNIRISPNGGTVVDVPVTLTLTPPPSVSASPANLTFSFRAGGANPAAQTVDVSGNGGALAFTAIAAASNGGNWLKVSPASGTTPASGTIPVSVSVDGTGLAPDTYRGTVTIAGSNGAPGSTTINVTLTVTAPLPTIARLTNAASYAAGSIAPGEIITIFGTDLGPATPVELKLDSNGNVATTLGGVQVTVGGFLAPMVYVSGTQVTAVVPYELAPFASATVQLKYLNQTSNGVLINIATSAPGLFTRNASGTGPGAILNQNGTPNTASNPAARGETVVLYLTGEGQTSPAGVTGKVTTVNPVPPLTPRPLLPVSVMIGGQPAAAIPFAGEAPSMVSGVLQVNVVVPTTVAAGEQPITVSVGGNRSQDGVTISLR